MELKIEQYTPATEIAFNYDELKTELQAKANMYASVVYTEDTVKDAKKDRAALNTLRKALNDERIRREREFMAPFNDFKSKINEIIGIIDQPLQIIDNQVKAFEDAEKERKREAIVALWDSIDKPDFVTLGRIWNDKMLNKTVSLESIETEMHEFIDRITSDLATMERMNCDEIAIEAYKKHFDITLAIDEAERIREMQKAAEERRREAEERRARLEAEAEAQRIAEAEAAERRKAEQNATESTQSASNDANAETIDETKTNANAAISARWMRFEAFMTREQAIALRDFCNSNGIELRRPQD